MYKYLTLSILITLDLRIFIGVQSLGDRVRVSSLKGIFDREYDFKWSGEIFIVKNRYRRDGSNVYHLKDCMDEDIKGGFHKGELQKVKVDDEYKLWKISKVFKTRKNKGR